MYGGARKELRTLLKNGSSFANMLLVKVSRVETLANSCSDQHKRNVVMFPVLAIPRAVPEMLAVFSPRRLAAPGAGK